jgi:signal transduction histidine kinase
MAAIAGRLRLPVPVQDALLVVFVALFQIRGTLLVTPGQIDVRPLTEPGHLGYALLAGSAVALLVRRRWPAGVFIVVAVIDAAYYLVGYPDGPGWVALFVALYTLTAHGDGYRSLQTVTAGIAALTTVWLLTADLWPLNDAGWVFFRIGAAVMAAALGESVRGHRVIAAEAGERAARAEQSREDEARRRVDAERLRIAREVHDAVAHALSVVNVQAAVTAHVLDRRPEQARATLQTIERVSARALQDLRATLGVLRQETQHTHAEAPGLDQLEQLAATARQAGLQVHLDVWSPDSPLPDTVKHATYRVVQESLTNVIRHAGPATVTITLHADAHVWDILIVDDGLPASGDDDGPSIGGLGGRGIVGMRERAALLGGQLTAGTQPAGGWRVHARIPLQPEPVASR